MLENSLDFAIKIANEIQKIHFIQPRLFPRGSSGMKSVPRTYKNPGSVYKARDPMLDLTGISLEWNGSECVFEAT